MHEVNLPLHAYIELVLITGNYKISKFLSHESNNQKTASALGIIELGHALFSF